MKQFFSLILALAMALSLSACADTNGSAGGDQQSEGEVLETVTVTGMDANGEPIEVEVPYKPGKVMVLDLADLDILDNLGLGGPHCRRAHHHPALYPVL